MYQYRCENCGAYLDPDEKCDCKEEAERERERREGLYKREAGSDQFTFNWPAEGVKV